MNLFKDDILKGQGILADQMKLFVHKTNPALFELIDFENDECYLEPLLFAQFFAKKFSKNIEVTEEELLIGYINPVKTPNRINIITDKLGIAYLPKIGYYKTDFAQSVLELQHIDNDFRNAKLTLNNHNITYEFIHIQTLADTGIEIAQSIHPLIYDQFHESINQKSGKGVPVDTRIAEHVHIRKEMIHQAWGLIEKYFPDLSKLISSVGRKIIIYDHPKIISFASRVTHGSAYLSARNEDGVLFYFSEIIHQFAHNILYSLLVDVYKYFKVNPYEKLSDFTGNKNEERSLYSAFHGLFTTSQLAVCFESLYDLNILTGKSQLELTGRLVDNYRRFRTGLEKLNLNDTFTEKGLQLYTYLDQQCCDVYDRKKSLIKEYDVSNQPFVFNFNMFFNTNL